MSLEKFKNKYRIGSTRLKEWNYADNGCYFVTIRTKDRENFFGNINNGKMIFSDIGKMADRFWQEIQAHFSFINLGEYMVMPNHVHGIIFIDRGCHANAGIPTNDRGGRDVAMQRLYDGNCTNTGNNPNIGIPTIDHDGYRTNAGVGENQVFSKISPIAGSISTIIRSYKSIVSKTAKTQYANTNFAWLPRYYDHIIRNGQSLNHIRQYIINNPARWELDRNNPENLYM